MKKFFGTKKDDLIILDGEETKHLAVLRCVEGEQVVCFCGDKFEYDCKILRITKKDTTCQIVEQRECKKNPTKHITLFQGLPKLDKLELITQKITELGITELVPFESDYTIAKTNLNKMDRLNRISQEACKQCGRSIPLKIAEPVKFKKVLEMIENYDLVLFANETNRSITDISFDKHQKIAIIIGSEGGFSPSEIEFLKDTTQIGLGERILRTETASIVLCGIVSYLTKN